jgi:hypothetical protein
MASEVKVHTFEGIDLLLLTGPRDLRFSRVQRQARVKPRLSVGVQPGSLE